MNILTGLNGLIFDILVVIVCYNLILLSDFENSSMTVVFFFCPLCSSFMFHIGTVAPEYLTWSYLCFIADIVGVPYLL